MTVMEVVTLVSSIGSCTLIRMAAWSPDRRVSGTTNSCRMLLSVSWSVSCGTMSPWSRFHFARGLLTIAGRCAICCGSEKEQGQNRQRAPQQCHVIYLLEITASGGVYAFAGKRFSIFFVLMSSSAPPEHSSLHLCKRHRDADHVSNRWPD
jgi:hypothetical protein